MIRNPSTHLFPPGQGRGVRVERVAVVVMAGQVRHRLGRRRRQLGGGGVEIPIDGTAGRNEERVGPVHDPVAERRRRWR